MAEATAPSSKPIRMLSHNLKLFLPAVLLFFVLMGFQLWRLTGTGTSEVQANGMPISREIEERYGIRFTGLHVVGKGGLVDLRYRIVDAAKAKNFGHYTETSPLIIDESSGRTVEVTIHGLHNHRVETGRIYYVLYRNTANAIQPGSKVTIQMGDFRLANVVAR